MSDLRRTRVHCFLLEENFAFHLLFGCSGRLERSSATNESLLVTREATPSGGNAKGLHRSHPSQKHCHAARDRCGLSVRANSSSLGGAGEDSSHPIQSFATGQCSRTAESPPRCPSLSQKDGGQKENNYRHQRRGTENKRRSISHDRGVQAYHHAAGKCRGQRLGRQPHGALCNLTRVSI